LNDALTQLKDNKLAMKIAKEQINKQKRLQTAREIKNSRSVRMMTKVKLKTLSKENQIKRVRILGLLVYIGAIKMEAKELKSGIARYLLAHISK